MSTAAATEARIDLDDRLTEAVLDAAKAIVGLDAWGVAVDEQERHIDRMVVCQHSLVGEGWVGSLSLLVPEAGAEWITATAKNLRAGERLRGGDMADALAAVNSAIALKFSEAFTSERKVVVGMPIVMKGTDVAVAFPWGNDFETRLSFKSEPTPFWAILRMSRVS